MRRWSMVLVVLLVGGCSAEGAHVVGFGPAVDSGGGTDAGSPPPPGGDICGNGIDDNGNGLIDEACPCAEGQRQACWPGSPTRRGYGACRDGFQVCEPYGEFFAWGSCEGAVLPSAEIEGNGIDEDCDGNDPGTTCLASEFGEGCAGGADDDCDGLIDCADPDCMGSGACMSSCVPSEFGELCSDGLDNDCDSQVDCVDADCGSEPSCSPPPPPPPGCRAEFPFIAEIACGDGRDNDCDGNIDCADSDCVTPGRCGCAVQESACSDGMDEDCDGSTDCADIDCQDCVPGTFRWCDEPMYCHWGKQDCGSDGRWGACVETTDRPSGCSGSLYSATCCEDNGGCCQNYPVDDTSIGTCAGIVSCS